MSQLPESSQGNEFEVESILAEKPISGTCFSLYKVRWKGFGKEHDTWEPEGHLAGCGELLAAWRMKYPYRDRHNGKRKTDAMDLDDGTPGYSESSSSERPTRASRKARRIYNIPQPGTVAYVRYRQSLTPDHDKPIHQDRRIFLDKLQNIEGPPVVLFNDVDEDPCPPVAFEFIPRYKFTEGVVDFVSENTDFWAGCSCEGGMCKKDCSCIQDNGYHGKMFYDKHGRLTLNDNVNSVIHECNKRCSCGENCLNRVVQRGRKIPLEIFKTEKKGWGLRCPQRIPKGAFVDTYTGELITLREAEKRLLEYNDSGLSYLFDLDMFSKVHRIEEDDEEQLADPRDPAVATVDPKDIYVIDGKDYGGVTRFINHSCDPNLLIYAVTRERADDRLYDLAMFALRDIPAYTELSFSYVGDTDRREPEDGTERWDCFCGADNCKGYLW